EQFGIRGMIDDFGTEQKQIALAADAQTVKTLQLPEKDVPASFSGAVGNFSLTESVGPTNVAVGDPVTVKIQIAGRGSLNNVSLPAQSAWRDFKMYPPTTKVETTDQLGLQGTKYFEQVVVPQNVEVRELPPLEFSYF